MFQTLHVNVIIFPVLHAACVGTGIKGEKGQRGLVGFTGWKGDKGKHLMTVSKISSASDRPYFVFL